MSGDNQYDSYDDSPVAARQMQFQARGSQNKNRPENRLPRYWQYDELTETSLLGVHFAQAVAAISSGQVEELLEVNRRKPERKTIFSDPQTNTPLQYAHISHECEAHFLEQSKAWNKTGPTFPLAVRKCKVPTPKQFVRDGPDPDRGTKVFGRNRDYLPFARRKKLLTDHMKHDISLVKAAELRTESIGPNTYKLPDPWMEKLKPVCGILPESSIFKSKSKRFEHNSSSSSSAKTSRASTAPPRSRSAPSAPSALGVPKSVLDQYSSYLMQSDNGPSLDGVDSWESAVFDKVGDYGSVVVGAEPRTVPPPRLSETAAAPQPRLSLPPSRPASPDLIITSLQLESHELKDHLRTKSISPSRARSAESIWFSHLPGPSFTSRPSTTNSSIQNHVEDAYLTQKMKEWDNLNIDGVSTSVASPPKSAPASLSNLSHDTKSVSSQKSPPFIQQDKHEGLFFEPPTASLSGISAPSTSYNKALLSRWNPPMCYSKKPLHEHILLQQRLALQHKMQILEDMGGPSLVHSTHRLIHSANQKKEIHLPLVSPQKSVAANAMPSQIKRETTRVRPHTTIGK